VATWMVFESLMRRAYQRELMKRFALVFAAGLVLGAGLAWALMTLGS
jgi:hypothetical protein